MKINNFGKQYQYIAVNDITINSCRDYTRLNMPGGSSRSMRNSNSMYVYI